MSKTIVIKEGGQGKQLTADKLKTNLLGGGTCLWVPEDEVGLGTIHISKNGTYTAEDEGYYGFSEVTVSGVGKVVGRDPQTGEQVQVTADETTGEIITTPIPASIEITKTPSMLIYNNGDLIYYSGIEVKLRNSSGGAFTNEDYPDGVVPVSELVFPVEVASIGDSSWISGNTMGLDIGGITEIEFASGGTLVRGDYVRHYLFKEGSGMFTSYNTGAHTHHLIWASKDTNAVALAYSTDTTHTGTNWERSELTLVSALVLAGKTVYYRFNTAGTAGGGADIMYPVCNNGEILERGLSSEQAANLAWLMIYDGAYMQDIPVNWVSPYDNETYTATFQITIREDESQE